MKPVGKCARALVRTHPHTHTPPVHAHTPTQCKNTHSHTFTHTHVCTTLSHTTFCPNCRGLLGVLCLQALSAPALPGTPTSLPLLLLNALHPTIFQLKPHFFRPLRPALPVRYGPLGMTTGPLLCVPLAISGPVPLFSGPLGSKGWETSADWKMHE